MLKAIGITSGLGVLVALLFRIYLKFTTGVCRSKVTLGGKTVIVTGSNTGIGLYTALDLARRNARVILACRSEVKGREARSKIIFETGNKNVVVKVVDLSSMSSVRKFAKEILEEEQHLHILINNAGMAGSPKQITEEGLEKTFASNHFGPFLLTYLLLDLLKASAPSRIVNVSSLVHQYGRISLDNLCCEKSFNKAQMYFDTKLANVLFTRELAKRLAGTGVAANCLHPGSVQSDLFRMMPFLGVVGAYFSKTAEEGAQTSLHCAVSEEIEGISGKYFSDCAIKLPAQQAMDDQLANKFWKASCKLVGVETDKES